MNHEKHEHHHEEHHQQVEIIVNTRIKAWDKKEITYEEVIILAFSTYVDNPNVLYSVTYIKGHDPKHEGSLTKGQSVKVKEGMIFNVRKTDKS
jgi:hypothetical protein